MILQAAVFFDLIHSPDDGGWYAEVYDQNGIEMYVSELFGSQGKATSAARDWCEHHGYTARMGEVI